MFKKSSILFYCILFYSVLFYYKKSIFFLFYGSLPFLPPKGPQQNAPQPLRYNWNITAEIVRFTLLCFRSGASCPIMPRSRLLEQARNKRVPRLGICALPLWMIRFQWCHFPRGRHCYGSEVNYIRGTNIWETIWEWDFDIRRRVASGQVLGRRCLWEHWYWSLALDIAS